MGGGLENRPRMSSTDSYSPISLEDLILRSEREKIGMRQTGPATDSEVDALKFQEWKKRILQQTQMLKIRAEDFEEYRQNILRYKPGQWVAETGGVVRSKFAIPNTTTLLLVGPMGAGKSTLVNNLLRVVNNLDRGFDRAQVCDDPKENGTFFLEEYALYEGSNRLCIFDTRGLLENNLEEDLALLERWMQDGVSHGQMILRASDSGNMKQALEIKARLGHHKLSEKRQVNFVIFVVSAIYVHKMRMSKSSYSQAYLARVFKSPYLTFKDDQPVVVLTHGDELSMDDRVAARIELGKILGISPVDQIFDIAGFTGRAVEDSKSDLVRDMALLDMLEYALQHADWNLPYKMGIRAHTKQAWENVQQLYDNLGGGPKIALFAIVFCWVLALGLLLASTSMVLLQSTKRSKFCHKKAWYK